MEALRTSTGIAWRVWGSTASAQSTNSDALPVGTSVSGYWTSPPSGYLLENGAAVSRTTYADLFAVIGTTFGAGDGSTTFNLPDSRGRVAVSNSNESEFNVIGERGGSKTHTNTLTNSGWARIGFDINNSYFGLDNVDTAQWGATRRISAATSGTTTATVYQMGARLEGNTGSGDSIQPYIVVTRVIKY